MTTTKNIQFGTSGHRGIIGKTFTSTHTKAIGEAVSQFLLDQKDSATVVVGYDPRTGNHPKRTDGSYTQSIVETLIQNGINVWVTETYTPTPVISWIIDRYQLDGGLILTASHNPPNYNGIKFNTADGGPASSFITEKIEELANEFYVSPPKPQAAIPGTITEINKTTEFATALIKNLSQALQVKTLQLSNIKLAIDAKHGTAGETWQALIQQLGIQTCEILHESPAMDFGGVNPNPTQLSSLTALKIAQHKLHADIACAHDPDADRHMILDETGSPLTPEETCTIILDYFITKGCPMLGVATTLASSMMIQTACQNHQLDYFETPVGFKHFNSFLKQGENSSKVTLAVESSGGFSASFHTLEKCGFLPVVLLMLIIQETKTPLSKLNQKSHAQHGTFYFKETCYTYEPNQETQLRTSLQDLDLTDIQPYFRTPIDKLLKKDGTKLKFENGDWVLVRLSGTEPVARIYSESKGESTATQLNSETEHLLEQILV